MDEYQKSIDYKNYNFETDRKFESGLIKLRNELDTKTKEKINEIMQINNLNTPDVKIGQLLIIPS